MRFAEIASDGLLELTISRALKHENGGCLALAKNHKTLTEIMARTKLENPFPWLDLLEITEARKRKISRDLAAKLRKLCADQGLNWGRMNASERKRFISNQLKSHPFKQGLELRKRLKQRAKGKTS